MRKTLNMMVNAVIVVLVVVAVFLTVVLGHEIYDRLNRHSETTATEKSLGMAIETLEKQGFENIQIYEDAETGEWTLECEKNGMAFYIGENQETITINDTVVYDSLEK